MKIHLGGGIFDIYDNIYWNLNFLILYDIKYFIWILTIKYKLLRNESKKIKEFKHKDAKFLVIYNTNKENINESIINDYNHDYIIGFIHFRFVLEGNFNYNNINLK